MADLFYVYQLRRADEAEPFYIGKGKDKRAWDHLKSVDRINLHKQRKIDKSIREGVSVEVEILFSDLSETEAFDMEKKLILEIGRGKNGPLTNLTDGGEGVSGYVFPEHIKQRLRAISKRQWSNPQAVEAARSRLIGKPSIARWSEESKESASLKMAGNRHRTGKNNSKEHNKKISEANKGRVQRRVSCRYCGYMCTEALVNRWHNDNCRSKP